MIHVVFMHLVKESVVDVSLVQTESNAYSHLPVPTLCGPLISSRVT